MSEANKENINSFLPDFTPLDRQKRPSQKPCSSRRFTPYSTPHSARFTRIPSKTAPNFEKDDIEELRVVEDITNLTSSPNIRKKTPRSVTRKARKLTEITDNIRYVVGKTWRLNQCSPLYNFEYKSSSLHNYNKLLGAHLEAESAKGIAFEVGQDNLNGKFNAEFEILKDFAYYDKDTKGIKVSVYHKDKPNRGKNSQPLLDAIFCNFGNDVQDNTRLEGFTCLPLCIVKGTVALAKCVFKWFEGYFDCTITPVTLPPIELSWYASLWAGLAPAQPQCNLELCFSVPSRVEGLNRVTFSIDANDAKLLWESCHSGNSDIYTGQESELFMDALESHFYRHFKIHLGSLSLSRVCNSVVYLGCEGRLKILEAKYARHVLQQITAMAQEHEQSARL